MELEAAKKALVNAHNAGDVNAARQIATFITQQEKPATKEISRGQAALSSYIRNIPFGTDIASGIAAPITAIGANIPMGDAFQMAKESFMEDVQAGKEQYPYTSGAAGLGGAVISGLAVPSQYYQGASMLSSALKGGGLAAAQGFGYGAQEGENVSERIGSGIFDATVAAPFGAAGSVAADLLTGGAGAVSRKAQDIANRNPVVAASSVAAPVQGQGGDNTLRAIRLGLNQVPDSSVTAGKQIPLTQGQLTQSPRLQSLEFGAQGGMYGDEARQLAMQSREVQSDAAKQALSRVGGTELAQETPYQAGETVLKTLKDAYKSARMKTSREYGKLSEYGDTPLKIAADYIKKGVVPEIQNWARKGSNGFGFDLQAPGMENASRLYKQASDFMKLDKITSVNFTKLEQWRGRVSQGIANSQVPSEKAFLSGMLERFDNAMNVLPREAVKSGDEAMLTQLIKARGARASQGKLFERNKLVADILEKDVVTNEQMANMLFGASKDAPLRLEAMIKAVGPQKAKELVSAAKGGTYASILKKSLSSELKQGQVAEEMISFDKLATNLNELVNNKPTLFKMLHPDPSEQAAVKQLLEDVKRIKSVKPGSKNYSNTAYTILDVLRRVSPAATATSVPLVGSVGGAAEAVAKAGATAELSKSLQPVLQDTISAMEGPVYNFTEKFGRPALVSATSWTQRKEQ